MKCMKKSVYRIDADRPLLALIPARFALLVQVNRGLQVEHALERLNERFHYFLVNYIVSVLVGGLLTVA